MKQYLLDLQYILDNGIKRNTRSGDTLSIFGMQSRYNLQEGFPAVSTKKLAFNAVKSELLWFLEGSTDERRLCEILHGTHDIKKKTIWTANADKQGVNLGYENNDYKKELGPIYGAQWRDWMAPDIEGQLVRGVRYIDQVKELIQGIKDDPTGRRHILTAWNPGDIEKMSLPPCHMLSQFYVQDNKLSCMMTQRSMDAPLGGPFNIASYALLTHMIAQVCGLGVGEFIHTVGDAHIYLNQVDQVKELLKRKPYPLPELWINPNIKNINDFTMDDFKLINYNPHPEIKIPFSV